MIHVMRITITVLAALMIVCSSNAETPASPAPTTAAASVEILQGTPQELLETQTQILIAGDQDAAMKIVDASGPRGDLPGRFNAVMVDHFKAMIDFSQLVVAKYGKDDAAAHHFVSMVDWKAKMGTFVIAEESADRAVATNPSTPQKLVMVKQDGKWYLEAESMLPASIPDAQVKMQMSMMKAMTQVTRELMPQIENTATVAELAQLKMQKEAAAARVMAEEIEAAMQQAPATQPAP